MKRVHRGNGVAHRTENVSLLSAFEVNSRNSWGNSPCVEGAYVCHLALALISVHEPCQTSLDNQVSEGTKSHHSGEEQGSRSTAH